MAELNKLTIEQLHEFADEVRAILVDESGYWRNDLSGADVIEALSLVLDQVGLGGEEDDGERDECGGCGQSFNATESDAAERDTYCSAECEADDTGVDRG